MSDDLPKRGEIELPPLETMVNLYPGTDYVSEHTTDELIALCPMSGLPDYYSLILRYGPDKRIIELKSLKLYLVAFKDACMLHEDIINRIVEDLVEVVEPMWLEAELEVAVRGGIETRLYRMWVREDEDQ